MDDKTCGRVLCFNFLLNLDCVWWQLSLQWLEATLQAVGLGPCHAWLWQDRGQQRQWAWPPYNSEPL